jgi:arginine decarboxylase
LLRFKDLYDADAPLKNGLSGSGEAYPDHAMRVWAQETLQRHPRLLEGAPDTGDDAEGFQVIPDQAMKPSEAYHQVVRKMSNLWNWTR